MALTKAERKEMNQFTYRFKMDGKRVSKKAMVERYGKDKLEERMLDAARYAFEEDMEPSYWMDGLEISPMWK